MFCCIWFVYISCPIVLHFGFWHSIVLQLVRTVFGWNGPGLMVTWNGTFVLAIWIPFMLYILPLAHSSLEYLCLLEEISPE